MSMPEGPLPRGLRHVLAHVFMGEGFPPAMDTAMDIAFMRAANRATMRKAQGTTDAFLFVFVGKFDSQKVIEAVTGYGFADAMVIVVDGEPVLSERQQAQEMMLFPEGTTNAVEVEAPSLGYESACSAIDMAISKWLSKDHPAAIARFTSEYSDLEFWWSGIEQDHEVFEWPMGVGDYADALPSAHRDRAGTWLTLLGLVVDLDDVLYRGYDSLGKDHAIAWAATLCEWLHGFEAACGNGFNHFEEELSAALMPSDLYLGFQLARFSGEDLDSICDAHETDIDGLRNVALKAITAERRHDLRQALSDFFGGEAGLFWALHSAIWPNFEKPMADTCSGKLGISHWEEFAELDTPWRYITAGWCEEADH